MEYLHHRPIRKFNLDGIIHDESAIARLKAEYIRLLTSEMKFLGYVIRLDVSPDFTINYIEEKEHFTFELSVYGTYVGKRKSKWITGIDGTQIMHTPKSKSKESSQVQESQSNQK